jgi:hypothetical protein
MRSILHRIDDDLDVLELGEEAILLLEAECELSLNDLPV